MKRILSVKLFLVVLICGYFINPVSGDEIMNDSKLKEIKMNLSPGWDMKIEEGDLIFSSQKDVWVLQENNINAPISLETFEEKENRIKKFGKKMKPMLKYKLEKKWTQEEITAAEKKNDQIYEKIDALPDKYDIRHLFNKFASSKFATELVGETPEENERIEKYNKEKEELEKQLITIPELFSENYSITFSDAVGWTYEYSTVAPEEISAEVWGIWHSVNDTCRIKSQ